MIGNGGGNPPQGDWQQKRFGANPPAGLVNLAELATREIYAACGLSSALFGGSDAAGTREAWRLALFGTIAPLGRIVETELRRKLDDDVSLSWDELRASDLSGPRPCVSEYGYRRHGNRARGGIGRAAGISMKQRAQEWSGCLSVPHTTIRDSLIAIDCMSTLLFRFLAIGQLRPARISI